MSSWLPKADETISSLPAWSSVGILPEGDYWPSRGAFEERLVDMGGSKSRKPIYAGWNRHRLALLGVGCDSQSPVLLNGSYTTDKVDPGDLDLVVFFPFDPEQPADQAQFCANIQLLQGAKMKAEFLCDAYPVPVLPEDHPDYARVTGKAVEYWLRWFGTDRAKRKKGRIWSRLKGLP